MPHSLRAKLSGLRYKKIITDKDYDRLCKALDNEDVLDKVRSEIVEMRSKKNCSCSDCIDIIDKYRGE